MGRDEGAHCQLTMKKRGTPWFMLTTVLRCVVEAELTGFEPAIFCVTGRHVRPLHHSSLCCAFRNASRHLSGASTMIPDRLHSVKHLRGQFGKLRDFFPFPFCCAHPFPFCYHHREWALCGGGYTGIECVKWISFVLL